MHVGVFLEDIGPEVGGGHTFVQSVARAFVRTANTSSHRFTLFCSREYAEHVRRDLYDNVSVYALAARGLVGRGLSVLSHASPAFGLAWRFPSRLSRLCASRGIDLMWFVGGLHDTLDVPYITTVWDVQHLTHPWFPEVSAGGRWDYREAFLERHLRRATRIITGTSRGREELVHFYRLAHERIHILPHPTPDFALEAMTQDACSTQQAASSVDLMGDYLVYPAQFWPHKNHVNLLHAMRELRNMRANAPVLLLVGSDKGNRAHVERYISELKLHESVRVLGFVSTPELIKLYRGAEALVYPSFSGPENLPPLEAFALGCPVVCAEYPGAREQLEDAAIYFNPGQPAEIAKAIIRVLDDEPLRAKLIERGLQRAARWTSKEFVQSVFAMIDEFEVQRKCWP